MERINIPENYDQCFPEDWEAFLHQYLKEKEDFRQSPSLLQGVRQFIKTGLEAEFLRQINQGLPPELAASSSRLTDIYSYVLDQKVWPFYGLGCNHCVEGLDPIAPFIPVELIDGLENLASQSSVIISELSKVRRRIRTETKEFIYTGTWRSVNLWDSASVAPLPATGLFPETMGLLMDLPLFRDMHDRVKKGAIFKSFIVRISLLKPGTVILPHFGLTNTRLRLQIPLEIPCGELFIYSHDQRREWTLGEALVLNDSYMHGVYNSTDGDRIVLLIDLPHPSASADQLAAF